MNESLHSRIRRVSLVWTTLWLAFLFTAVNGDAAEYSEADDVPAVMSIKFTASGVALIVSRESVGYGLNGPITYFFADRESFSFREISEQAFNSLTMDEQDQESTSSDSNLEVQVSSTDDCTRKGYSYDGGDLNMTGRVILNLESGPTYVELLCWSSVSSAVAVDEFIWIGTYTVGDHGIYGAQGVLVVSKDGGPAAQLDIGDDIVNKILVDPWSSDVWVATHSQLFRVASNTTVLARYSPYRDFNYDEQRPIVRVVAADKPIKNYPLAVLADWLGPASYRALSAASENGVQLPGEEPLYRFAMFGNYTTHQPQWPEELSAALKHAQPTFGWRKFACLLPGNNAKTLCTTELGEWPKESGSYLGILNERYPGFAVTGPVFGPKGNESLRGNRHSPNNFADDILFGDFDFNGIRDFAAVLIEQGVVFDPYQDKGPVGFAVVCSGNWISPGQIEYSCSDLTEREPGGFRAELDYVDWAPWADTLIDRRPRVGDRFCPFMLQINPFNQQTKKGNKKLSILSSFGHCDWFFYHLDGQYRGCQYCAD